MTEIKDKVLDGEAIETPSSDSYITRGYLESRSGVEGTTGVVIDAGSDSVLVPKMTTGALATVEPDPEAISSVVDYNKLSAGHSARGLHLVVARVNRKKAA
jgi:hypothetical protein